VRDITTSHTISLIKKPSLLLLLLLKGEQGQKAAGEQKEEEGLTASLLSQLCLASS